MLSRSESRLEVILKMISHSKLLDFVTECANADKLWERVKKMSARGQQAFVDEIDDLHIFVKEFAGGIAVSAPTRVRSMFVRLLLTSSSWYPRVQESARAPIQVAANSCPKIEADLDVARCFFHCRAERQVGCWRSEQVVSAVMTR